MRILYKAFKFLSSIKLAVVVILSLAALLCVGTFFESKYDAQYAQTVVYQSPWMYSVWALLCLNLIHVMIDRWPWRGRHAGFVCAHIGILILLLGSVITRLQGIDGVMSLSPGKNQSWLSLNQPELMVYSSLGEGEFRALLKTPLQLLLQHPKKTKQKFQFADTSLQLLDYEHYARVVENIEAESLEAPHGITAAHQAPRLEAVQFQLEGSMGVHNEWLLRPSRSPQTEFNFGPARVLLSREAKGAQKGNSLILISHPRQVQYAIYSQSQLIKSGVVQQGQLLETGWMDWKFRLVQHHHRARIRTEIQPASHPQGTLTRAAVLVELEGQQQWLPFQSSLRFFTKNKMYVVSFGRQRRVLPFELQLKKFYTTNYPGTNKAASYASLVQVEGREYTISMNQPLKYGGFTFYQSSFEKDKAGLVQASILSVNKDPGRWIKYLGSSLVVLGTLLLFTRGRGGVQLPKGSRGLRHV